MTVDKGSDTEKHHQVDSSGAAIIPDDVLMSVVIPDEPDPQTLIETEEETPGEPGGSDPNAEIKPSKKDGDQTGDKITFTDFQGKEITYTREQVIAAHKAEHRLGEREAKLTQHSQENATAFKKIENITAQAKIMLDDPEVLSALDEHYGGKDKNPIRLMKSDTADADPKAKPDSDTDKRLKALEATEKERTDNAEAENRMAKARDIVQAEIDELLEIDPTNLKKGKVPNQENIHKILQYAADWNNKNKGNSDFQPMPLMKAWMEVFGKSRLGLKNIKSKKVTTKTTPGSAPGVKKETPTGKPKTMEEAKNTALQVYMNTANQ